MSESPHLTKERAPKETTDSSSSRESSPERVSSRKQRSFSPESESSDTAAPQITVSDSSPPADLQPFIRQGLAFRTVSTRNINTYEPAVKPGDAAFLPGQEVQPTPSSASTSAQSPVALGLPLSSTSSTPAPPASSSNPATPSPHLSAMSTPSDKSAAQKGTKKVAKTISKKAKQVDDTSFTTGRFRLSQYSAIPNDAPPLLHGQGPYASVYRTGVEVPPSGPGPEPSSSPVASTTSAPSSGTRIIMADPTKSTRRSSKPQLIQPTTSPVQDEPTSTSPTQARPRSANHPRGPLLSQPLPQNTLPPPANPTPRGSITQPGAPTMVSPGGSHPAHAQNTSGYYRRNYERDTQQPPTRSEHSRPPPTPVQMNDPRSADAMMAPPPGESPGPQSKGKEREIPGQRQSHHSEPARPPRGNVRLVTALIEDNRANPPDHLLAEVYIRCWSGGRPDELWCDAKDLSEALQASASRIDGPAKVYTQRGAYRQCFLRITAEQEDRYNSMNLALASDRTIPISVEYWAPPGAQPKPGVDWRMPWHGSPTFSHAHAQPPQPQYHSYQHAQPPPHHHSQSQHHLSHSHPQSQSHHPQYSAQQHDDGRHAVEPPRKRPSYNDQGSPDYPPTSPLRRTPYSAQPPGPAVHDPRYEASTVSRNPSSSHPRKRHLPDASPTDSNVQGDGVMDIRPDFKNSGFDSPHPEDVRQVVSDMIDELMRLDISVANYSRLIQSPVLVNSVKAYSLVEEIYQKYVGRLLPVKGTTASHKISEVDIARGLKAEDPRRFITECRETLWLLELYGERGKRGENPKVLEMLKENYRPDFSNVKPIKQLQKLLKDLDAQWMREHSEGGGGENGRSTPRMT